MSNVDPKKPRFEAPTYGSAGPMAPPQSVPPPPPSYAPSQPYGYHSGPPVAPRTNGLAIGALLTIFVFPMGIPAILGIVALKQIKESNGREKGQGLAITGIIVGSLMFLGMLMYFLGA